MLFHKEISDFIRSGGIDVREASLSNQKIFLARSAQTGRIIAVLPVCVSARDPYSAGIKSEVTFSIIKRLKAEYGSYPLVVTEDRWRRQQDMMKARVLAHLGIFDQIYARNCEVRKIDKKTAAEFLEAHHSYSDAACRYRYGLFLKRHTGHNAGVFADKSEEDILCKRHNAGIAPGTLVAVATFSNARKWKKGEQVIRSYEWTRYASLPGVRLSGGMGKLLNAFIEQVQPDDVMTYADLEWSEGEVYERLGFVFEGVKDGVMFCIDTDSWNRVAIKEQAMTSVDPRLRYAKAPPSRGWHVNSGHCPALQTQLIDKAAYFQNFGSNKYRLKLTDYQ